MRGGPEYAARIKCAGRGGPARGVRALCGAGLNGAGRPALPPLVCITLRSIEKKKNLFIFFFTKVVIKEIEVLART